MQVRNRDNVRRLVRMVELLDLPELEGDDSYHVDGQVISVPDKLMIQLTSRGCRILTFKPDSTMSTNEVNNLEVRGIILALTTSGEVIKRAALDTIRTICHNGLSEFKPIDDNLWSGAIIIINGLQVLVKFPGESGLDIYVDTGNVTTPDNTYVLSDEFMPNKEDVLDELRGYVHLLR